MTGIRPGSFLFFRQFRKNTTTFPRKSSLTSRRRCGFLRRACSGVATFYAHFTLEPKGKHVIRLCDGTACHVKNSVPILEALRSRLGVTEKNRTTPDMLFTVETVACLGACGLAPVLVIDDEVHGQMTPQRAVGLVEEIVAKEAVQ